MSKITFILLVVSCVFCALAQENNPGLPALPELQPLPGFPNFPSFPGFNFPKPLTDDDIRKLKATDPNSYVEGFSTKVSHNEQFINGKKVLDSTQGNSISNKNGTVSEESFGH